jgi:Lectin C-type domain
MTSLGTRPNASLAFIHLRRRASDLEFKNDFARASLVSSCHMALVAPTRWPRVRCTREAWTRGPDTCPPGPRRAYWRDRPALWSRAGARREVLQVRRAAAAVVAFAMALAGVVAVPGAVTALDVGPWQYNPATGHYYRQVDNLTWVQAESYAISVGGHLVTINGQAEQDWLAAIFTDPNLWIGMNDRAVEGSMVWSSGQPVTYTNWTWGEPNNCTFCGPVRVGNPDSRSDSPGTIGRCGLSSSSTTTAGAPIAPSAWPRRWLKPRSPSRSRSARSMFAGGTCSVGSSTSTTASRRDRIWVSDPHGRMIESGFPIPTGGRAEIGPVAISDRTRRLREHWRTAGCGPARPVVW